jgi:hypothetical protein
LRGCRVTQQLVQHKGVAAAGLMMLLIAADVRQMGGRSEHGISDTAKIQS